MGDVHFQENRPTRLPSPPPPGPALTVPSYTYILLGIINHKMPSSLPFTVNHRYPIPSNRALGYLRPVRRLHQNDSPQGAEGNTIGWIADPVDDNLPLSICLVTSGSQSRRMSPANPLLSQPLPGVPARGAHRCTIAESIHYAL